MNDLFVVVDDLHLWLHLPRRIHPRLQISVRPNRCFQRSCQVPPCLELPLRSTQYPTIWSFDIFDLWTPNWMAGAMAFVPLPAGIVLQRVETTRMPTGQGKGKSKWQNTDGKPGLQAGRGRGRTAMMCLFRHTRHTAQTDRRKAAPSISRFLNRQVLMKCCGHSARFLGDSCRHHVLTNQIRHEAQVAALLDPNPSLPLQIPTSLSASTTTDHPPPQPRTDCLALRTSQPTTNHQPPRAGLATTSRFKPHS
jgi:hypothetical protein